MNSALMRSTPRAAVARADVEMTAGPEQDRRDPGRRDLHGTDATTGGVVPHYAARLRHLGRDIGGVGRPHSDLGSASLESVSARMARPGHPPSAVIVTRNCPELGRIAFQ